MCDRTCPKCGSTEHLEQYGLLGITISCDPCGTILANRRDIATAHIDMTEEQAEAWQREGTFVLAGAEARDPADDQIFTPR